MRFARKVAKTTAIATGVLVAGAAAYDVASGSYIFTRSFRAVRCGIHIYYGYKIAFNEDNYLQIHESVAKDIYETCIKNDGLYVKLGQGIAALDHLLPPPFYKHLSKLQDKAQSTTYDQISQLFQQEVGRTIEESFEYFDKVPVASASIAQVHKAKLKNGQEVAVKIQKPNIKKQFPADMFMHHLINWVLEKSFDLPLLQFVEDIQKNLKKEIDFRIEAENSKRAEVNFRLLKRKQLYVPTIVDQFTRERVMVSEWIDGIKITQTKLMDELKYDKKDIMTKLIRAFSDQIFITGFVHCDPHPGNVLIRAHPSNSNDFQIVVLDHGLCLELNNKFRSQYSQFWRAMFLRRTDEMKRICAQWGIYMADEFAGSQMMRPYNSSKLIHQKVEKKDVMRLQREMKDKMKEMMKQAHNYPKELLFVNRNMNLVRSLNKHYGGIADRITIMAKSAYVGAETKDSAYPKTGFNNWRAAFFNVNLFVLEITHWFMKKFINKSIDEYIENAELKKTQQMFKRYGFKGMDEEAYNS